MALPLAGDSPSRPRQDYAWGCLFGTEFQITYLYGPARTCQAIGAGLVAGQYQPKGHCDTLAEARRMSRAMAAALSDFYGEADGARVISADDFPDGQLQLGLLFRRGVAQARGAASGVRKRS